MRQRLISAAALYLALAAVGAFIAVTQKLPYRFGGEGDPNNVWRDFAQGSGTAMSPPLGVLAVFGVFLLLATRGQLASSFWRCCSSWVASASRSPSTP
jgi:hypothetical protein